MRHKISINKFKANILKLKFLVVEMNGILHKKLGFILMLYYITLYYMTLHYTPFHYIVLHYIILQWDLHECIVFSKL